MEPFPKILAVGTAAKPTCDQKGFILMNSIAHLERLDNINEQTGEKQLKEYAQWVVWKYELVGKQQKKPLYSPHTHRRASSTDPHTWTTYENAHSALANYHSTHSYDGLGFVFSRDDPLCGIDLDHCRDPNTGEVIAWAQEIINIFLSYTEVSPSGEGIHIIIEGTLPGNSHKNATGTIELYDKERYFTYTGNHLPGTHETIEKRQSELDQLYISLFGNATEVKHVGGVTCDQPSTCDKDLSHKKGPVTSIDLTDEQLLNAARRGAKGRLFTQLYDQGSIPYYKPNGEEDPNRGDLALCGILAFYARGDANRVDRLFRASRLMRPKWDEKRGNSTYGLRTIEKAVSNRQGDYDPAYGLTPPPSNTLPKRKRIAQHITHAPEVKQSKVEETAEERLAILEQLRSRMKLTVEEHITLQARELLVVLSPPGVGKSHTIAELGEQTTVHPEGKINLAWISERRESVVPALSHYQQIMPCTRHNCDLHTLHNIVGERGFNTYSVHKQHLCSCDYTLQFRKEGSKRFQLAHVPTSYPSKHEAIVIDELDLTKWLPEREITVSMLHSSLSSVKSGSSADELIRHLQAVLVDAQRDKKPIHGKAFFDALNARTNGRLESLIIELRNIPGYENTHPWAEIDVDSEDAERQAQCLPYVVLPHLLNAIDAEFFRWKSGLPWNSLVRVGPGKSGTWSIFITQPLLFGSTKNATLPPIIILDATADEELLGLLFNNKIKINRESVTPTPGTKHIAIRTGKRYGKYALTAKKKDGKQYGLERAIAECWYFLNQADPSGCLTRSGKVGLITFAGCESQMREALDIPEGKSGHFWAMRGSNALEDCEILLVVGTPTLRPTEVVRLARALWRHSDTPIDDSSDQDEQTGKESFKDERVRRLNEYLTRAELTQCAHRVRPLKNANRTIITFCLGEIDYLPPTQTYTSLPTLTEDGLDKSILKELSDTHKLEQAYQQLEESGINPSVRTLKAASHLSTDAVAGFLRGRKEPESYQEHPPPTCNTHCESSVPVNPINITSCETGNARTGALMAPENAISSPLYMPMCSLCHSTKWKRGLDGKVYCSSCFLGPPLSAFQERLYCSDL